MTMNYIHIQEKYDYKRRTGEEFNTEETYGVKAYTTVISRELKDRYKEFKLPGDLVDGIIRESINTFKTVGKEVLKGNASLPVFRWNVYKKRGYSRGA